MSKISLLRVEIDLGRISSGTRDMHVVLKTRKHAAKTSCKGRIRRELLSRELTRARVSLCREYTRNTNKTKRNACRLSTRRLYTHRRQSPASPEDMLTPHVIFPACRPYQTRAFSLFASATTEEKEQPLRIRAPWKCRSVPLKPSTTFLRWELFVTKLPIISELHL